MQYSHALTSPMVYRHASSEEIVSYFVNSNPQSVNHVWANVETQ